MFAQVRSVAVIGCAGAALAGCSSANATPRPTATATRTAPTTVASATPVPVPPGPYAVVVTNSTRQGSTYDILLIDVAGQVVTRVTAKLPLLKPNQTVQLPLVSASNDLVYYLDGDTDIRSLSPAGDTVLVKRIAAGSGSTLGFAVSPDDHRVAVSVISQNADPNKDTGHGYVEDLADAANHVDLFSNTASDSLRWPVGWHGTDIVDAVGNQCGAYDGASYAAACGASYHVISSTNGARQATLCETPTTNVNQNTSPSGLAVSGGIACVKTEYYNDGTTPPEGWILGVDWSGHVSTFATADSTGQLPYGGCYLAPGGALMACAANTSQALTLLAPGAAPRNLGRRYNVLGWMDADHLLADIDSKTLAVVSAATGAAVALPLADADKMEMTGTAPGAL